MREFFLTDGEIQGLLDEPKVMSCSADTLLLYMKTKSGRGASHQQNSIKFSRTNREGEWLIYLRRSQENPLDFSCGLGLIPKGRVQAFTLIRYNGKSHQHTNRLENEAAFYDFHIHHATEKYQQSSYGDEHHAQPTNRYTNLHGALRSLLIDCKVTEDSPDDKQMRLFE